MIANVTIALNEIDISGHENISFLNPCIILQMVKGVAAFSRFTKVNHLKLTVFVHSALLRLWNHHPVELSTFASYR